MNEPKERRAAAAKRNDDFYLIETYSSYRSSGRDPLGRQHILPLTANAKELGAAVQDALAHSRFLSLEQAQEFFDIEKMMPLHAAWISDLMMRHNYKTKRALFKNMASCHISFVVGEEPMTISPSYHNKLEGWIRTKDDGIEDVLLPVDSSPDTVGQALLLAFSRCT